MREEMFTAIDKIFEEINDYIGDRSFITMLDLDNFLESYCVNSMFDYGSLDAIFETDHPEEGQVGEYAYCIDIDEIDKMLDEPIERNCSIWDYIPEVLIQFELINKNNCELSEEGTYYPNDYFEWIIKVIYVDRL